MFKLLFNSNESVHDTPHDALLYLLGIIGDKPIPAFHIFPNLP
jgi:hypothetical protein